MSTSEMVGGERLTEFWLQTDINRPADCRRENCLIFFYRVDRCTVTDDLVVVKSKNIYKKKKINRLDIVKR